MYRGQATEPVVSFAFANSGELQVELIEQEDDSPSIYREFLDAGREGFHHLAWWAEDFDAVARAAEDAGWPAGQHGNTGGMAQFAYYDAGRRHQHSGRGDGADRRHPLARRHGGRGGRQLGRLRSRPQPRLTLPYRGSPATGPYDGNDTASACASSSARSDSRRNPAAMARSRLRL